MQCCSCHVSRILIQKTKCSPLVGSSRMTTAGVDGWVGGCTLAAGIPAAQEGAQGPLRSVRICGGSKGGRGDAQPQPELTHQVDPPHRPAPRSACTTAPIHPLARTPANCRAPQLQRCAQLEPPLQPHSTSCTHPDPLLNYLRGLPQTPVPRSACAAGRLTARQPPPPASLPGPPPRRQPPPVLHAPACSHGMMHG